MDRCWPPLRHPWSDFLNFSEDRQSKIAPNIKDFRATNGASHTFKKIRKDWAKVKTVVMTRGVYIKCRTYPGIAQQLLDTDDRKLIENSQYDYYWGCGRDRRGDNHYGKVLMNVRGKLRSEDAEVEGGSGA